MSEALQIALSAAAAVPGLLQAHQQGGHHQERGRGERHKV